jgi:hypothetical protein
VKEFHKITEHLQDTEFRPICLRRASSASSRRRGWQRCDDQFNPLDEITESYRVGTAFVDSPFEKLFERPSHLSKLIKLEKTSTPSDLVKPHREILELLSAQLYCADYEPTGLAHVRIRLLEEGAVGIEEIYGGIALRHHTSVVGRSSDHLE